jgi:hypothetical protein
MAQRQAELNCRPAARIVKQQISTTNHADNTDKAFRVTANPFDPFDPWLKLVRAILLP